MNFLHSGSLGDVIYSIPTIRSIKGQFDKANLYLRPDVAEGFPVWAGQRQPVRFSRAEAEKLIPLLTGQQGFGEVAIYTDQAVDVDLDRFRDTGCDFGRGDIARYYCYAFKCQPCLHNAWLKVEPSDRFKGCVLVNRTQRYRNPRISYRFLAGHPACVFVGYKDEYAAFCQDCPRLPHVQAEDARQLASWIAGAKGFIGNQSFCYSLAEALKVPRLLEVYPHTPNVIPHGPHAADAINQPLFEEWANELLNRK